MLWILKLVEQMDLRKEMSEKPTTQGKYAGLGAALAAELMIGFWFGIEVILAVRVMMKT